MKMREHDKKGKCNVRESQIIKPKQIDTYSNETFWLSFTNHYQSYSNTLSILFKLFLFELD